MFGCASKKKSHKFGIFLNSPSPQMRNFWKVLGAWAKEKLNSWKNFRDLSQKWCSKSTTKCGAESQKGAERWNVLGWLFHQWCVCSEVHILQLCRRTLNDDENSVFWHPLCTARQSHLLEVACILRSSLIILTRNCRRRQKYLGFPLLCRATYIPPTYTRCTRLCVAPGITHADVESFPTIWWWGGFQNGWLHRFSINVAGFFGGKYEDSNDSFPTSLIVLKPRGAECWSGCPDSFELE